MVCVLVALTLFSSSPDAGVPSAPRLLDLGAPFGHIGDVFTAPVGQRSPQDFAEDLKLPGCPTSQTFFLSRVVSGVALGGSQLQEWMDAQPGLERKLFGKGKPPVFAQTLQRARSSVPVDGAWCPKLEDGWKLGGLRPFPLACKVPEQPSGVRTRALWPAGPGGAAKPKGAPAVLVQLSAAGPGTADACRPRLSVSFQDPSGKIRFRYHADFGGEVSAELLGDTCQKVQFTFDPGTQRFHSAFGPGGHGCVEPARPASR